VLGLLVAPVTVLAVAASFQASSAPLSPAVRAEVRSTGAWRSGCPVGLDDLRVLTVRHWGFDGRVHTGRLIVNRSAVGPLTRVFAKVYGLHFPIRHLTLAAAYVRPPRDGDISGSFACRPPVPSPCTPDAQPTSWSQHAYGLAVDLNQRENPYVGCGAAHDPGSAPYRDRSRHREGMVTPKVIAAFASIGWGWGGAWAGSTKDYTHFSASGH
jgi:hypothetical protein